MDYMTQKEHTLNCTPGFAGTIIAGRKSKTSFDTQCLLFIDEAGK